MPESLGELLVWCKMQDVYATLRKHNNLDDEYCLPLFSVLVIGRDINLKGKSFISTSTRSGACCKTACSMECGWVLWLNYDGTFRFCCAAIDMIVVLLLLYGWDQPSNMLVLHQTDGE